MVPSPQLLLCNPLGTASEDLGRQALEKDRSAQHFMSARLR